jgi:V-type H+-transporting ATPase subunit a
MNELG